MQIKRLLVSLIKPGKSKKFNSDSYQALANIPGTTIQAHAAGSKCRYAFILTADARRYALIGMSA
jgi:hypothetical protein